MKILTVLVWVVFWGVVIGVQAAILPTILIAICVPLSMLGLILAIRSTLSDFSGAGRGKGEPQSEASPGPFDETLTGQGEAAARGRVRVTDRVPVQDLYIHRNQPRYESRPCPKHERPDPGCPDCRFSDEPPLFIVK